MRIGRWCVMLGTLVPIACVRDVPSADAPVTIESIAANVAPVAPTGPWGLDTALCFAASVSDTTASSDPETASPGDRIARVVALEAELSRASAMDTPALLLGLGRIMPKYIDSRDSIYRRFREERSEEYGYNEVAGDYNYRGGALLAVIERDPEGDLADDAGYEMTLLPTYGECEGWIPCYVGRRWFPLAEFLADFPASPLAARAVDRALEAFEPAALTAELRYPTWEGDPSEFSSLAAGLDSAGSVVPPPNGSRLSERAAHIWSQLLEYDRARASLEAALTGANPEARTCLEAQLARVPTTALTLDSTRVIHTGLILVDWHALPAGSTSVAVYRSTLKTDLGDLVGQPAVGATSWSDSTTAADTTYWFRLAAETPSGVMSSNPVAAITPPPRLGRVQVAVSTRDAYLHVFGYLENGFPQVLRIALDGSVVEGRDAAHIGATFDPAFDPYVHEVWVAQPGGAGVLAFPGEPGQLPTDLLSAIREGRDLITEWPRRSGEFERYFIHVDETGGAIFVERRATYNTPGPDAMDCVTELSMCWLANASGGELRGFDGTIRATFRVEETGPANEVWADPRDGSAWIRLGYGRRLIHVGPNGAILLDTPSPRLFAAEYAGDLGSARTLWTSGRVALDGPDRLHRIDLEAATLTAQDVGAVPENPYLVSDLRGGVWVVGGGEAIRFGPDGTRLVAVPLERPRR